MSQTHNDISIILGEITGAEARIAHVVNYSL